ncbi:RICIN domain-containing protein [Micromonospora sp. NPDC003197]
MPIPDELSPPPGGTLYSSGPRSRLPRGRMLLVILAVSVVGILGLVGVLIGAVLGGNSRANDGYQAGPTATTASAYAPETAEPSQDEPTPEATPSSPTSAGQIFRLVHAPLCLDVVGGVSPEGAAVQQAECAGSPSQHWLATPAGEGTVTLVNVASGLCLDVYNLSTDDGAAVIQWTCNGGPNQQWRLTALGAGQVALVSVNSDKCVDVPEVSTTPGTKLQQWSCNNGTNQAWTVS